MQERKDGYSATTAVCSAIIGILMVGLPLVVEASQIAPSPNPFGSTIDITNDPLAANNETSYANNGIINVDSASTLTNTGTFSNTGTLAEQAILNNAGTLINVSGATLSNDVGGRLNNTGTLSSAGTLTNAFFLTNTGTLIASSLTNTGIMTNDTGGTLDVSSLTNHFAVTNNGTMTAGSIINSGLAIGVFNNGTMTTTGSIINNGGLSNSGTWTNTGGISNLLISGMLNAAGATFTNIGGISVGEQATLTNNGTLLNAGTISTISAVNNGGTLINTGSMTITKPAFLLTSTGVLTNNAVLINAGTITSTGAISGTGSFLQTAGQTINNGSITQASISVLGGSLSGTGTVTSNVTIGSGALLSPGDAGLLGKFTIHGNLQSSGDLLFRIQGLSVGQFNVLDVSGGATFTGGKVSFVFSGFDAKIGDSWDFFYASAISGWDSLSFLFTGLDSTERAQFHFHDGVETLRIVAVPEPSSFLFLGICLIVLGLIHRTKAGVTIAVGIFLLWPLDIYAAQIAPNPGTIDIINDPTAFNADNPFIGSINISSTSTLTNMVGGSLAGGPITNSGTINNFGGIGNPYPVELTNAVGATLNNYGGIQMGPFGGSITNAGTLNNFAYIAGSIGGGTINNTGTFNNFAGATYNTGEGSLGNALGATVNNSGSMTVYFMNNGGTLNNSGSFRCCTSGQTFNNSGTIINTGTFEACCLAFFNTGTILNTSAINAPQISNGGTLVNNGTITLALSVPAVPFNSGLLRGNGTVVGNVSNVSGGLLAPGDSSVLGKFTIHGNLESRGDFLFRIQGLSVGQFDALDISDTATFSGGKMTFAFSGFAPKIGDSWDFLYASAISGWDSLTFLFTGLDASERAMFHFHDGIETLRIVAVPEPSSVLLLSAGLAAIAVQRRRSR